MTISAQTYSAIGRRSRGRRKRTEDVPPVYERLCQEPRRRLRLRTEGAVATFDAIGRRGRRDFSIRADRMRNCGMNYTELVIKRPNGAEARQVRSVFRCNQRGCPNCDAMRSNQVGRDAIAMFEHHLRENPTDQLIFLTLTQPNVSGPALKAELDPVLKGWHKFTRRARVKNCVKGTIRSLEISYNPQRDDYHPHIHTILVVPETYKPGARRYIGQKEWAELWRDSYGAERRLVVWVERIDTTMVDGHLTDEARAKILQCCKYIVKPQEIYQERSDGTFWADPEVVETMHDATFGRRQLGFTGCLLRVRRKLKQGDPDDAPLPDGDEIPNDYVNLRLETYRWRRKAAVDRSWFHLVDTIELGCPQWSDIDRLVRDALSGADEPDTS